MNDTLDAIEKRKAWAVIGNTDLTEGRGSSFVISFHWCEASAIRAGKKKYVMGSNCPIDVVTLYKKGHQWYGPINVESPSKDDEKTQAEMDRVNAVLEKAKALGITSEELATLGYFK